MEQGTAVVLVLGVPEVLGREALDLGHQRGVGGERAAFFALAEADREDMFELDRAERRVPERRLPPRGVVGAAAALECARVHERHVLAEALRRLARDDAALEELVEEEGVAVQVLHHEEGPHADGPK